MIPAPFPEPPAGRALRCPPPPARQGRRALPAKSPMQILDDIEDLVRARYPILYVVSSEEARVEARWPKWGGGARSRCSSGAAPRAWCRWARRASHRSSVKAATRDALAALDLVMDHVGPALFVFKDLHPFLTRGNPAVIRRLKELARHLKESLKTVILVSPLLELPAELEKDVTVLQFPLADPRRFGGLARSHRRGNAAGAQVSVDLDEAGRERLLQSALGLTLGEAENVFAKLLVRHRRLGADQVPDCSRRSARSSGRTGCSSTTRRTRRSRRWAGWGRSRTGWPSAARPSRRRRARTACRRPRGCCCSGCRVAARASARRRRPTSGRCRCCASTWAACSAAWWVLGGERPPGHQRRRIRRPRRPVGGRDRQGLRRHARLGASPTRAPPRACSARSSPGCRRRRRRCSWWRRPTTSRSCRRSCCARAGFDEIFFVDLPGPPSAPRSSRIHLRKRGRDPRASTCEALGGGEPGLQRRRDRGGRDQRVVRGLLAGRRAGHRPRPADPATERAPRADHVRAPGEASSVGSGPGARGECGRDWRVACLPRDRSKRLIHHARGVWQQPCSPRRPRNQPVLVGTGSTLSFRDQARRDGGLCGGCRSSPRWDAKRSTSEALPDRPPATVCHASGVDLRPAHRFN